MYTKTGNDIKTLQTIAEAIHDPMVPGHFLQVPYNRTTRHLGSTSRAKAWTRAIGDPNSTIDSDPPSRVPGVQSSSPSRTELEMRVSEDLMHQACTEEINMDYINVVRLLQEYFDE